MENENREVKNIVNTALIIHYSTRDKTLREVLAEMDRFESEERKWTFLRNRVERMLKDNTESRIRTEEERQI